VRASAPTRPPTSRAKPLDRHKSRKWAGTPGGAVGDGLVGGAGSPKWRPPARCPAVWCAPQCAAALDALAHWRQISLVIPCLPMPKATGLAPARSVSRSVMPEAGHRQPRTLPRTHHHLRSLATYTSPQLTSATTASRSRRDLGGLFRAARQREQLDRFASQSQRCAGVGRFPLPLFQKRSCYGFALLAGGVVKLLVWSPTGRRV